MVERPRSKAGSMILLRGAGLAHQSGTAMRRSYWWSSLCVLLLLTRKNVVEAQGEPCSICPPGLEVTLPDVIIPAGFAFVVDADTSCADLQAQAEEGVFTSTECALIRSYGSGTRCGCETPTVDTPAPVEAPTVDTPAPVVQETPAPVVQETPAPVVPPTPSPTVKDTPAPTGAPVEEGTAAPVALTTVTAEFSVRLSPVTGELTDSSEAGYIESCTQFFGLNQDVLKDISCKIIGSTLTTERRMSRNLQVSSLDVLTGVTGTGFVDADAATATLIGALNNNADGFLLTLQSTGGDSFDTVETVTALAPAPITPAPITPAPTLPDGTTEAPSPSFGVGDLTDAPVAADGVTEVPVAAGVTEVPVAAGTTEVPVAAAATEAPVAAGTTEVPVAAGTTEVPVAGGITEAPVVGGATTPAPSAAGTSGGTAAPIVGGATTPSPSAAGTGGATTPAPSAAGTGGGTAAPVAGGAATPAPSAAGTGVSTPVPTPVVPLNITERIAEQPDSYIEVEASPFRVMYDLKSTVNKVDEESLEEVTKVTLEFLGDVLSEIFAMVDDRNIDFKYVVGARTDVSSNFKVFDYLVSAHFHPTSEVVPLINDIDALLDDIAFEAPAVETLLLLLHNLPKQNPYSQTTHVYYEMVRDEEPAEDGLSTTGIATMAGAFVIAIVVTGAAVARRKGWLYFTGPSPSVRKKSLSNDNVNDKTDREHSDNEAYDYASSLESNSMLDPTDIARQSAKLESSFKEEKKDDEEEQMIDFEYPKRIRKGAYVEPQGLFDAPFKDSEEEERYGLTRQDDV